jgi:phage terminase large subunit GpA-like protein
MDERYSTMWFPINTSIGKDDLMHKLLIKHHGTGYCHFPRTSDHEPIYGYDNGFFIGLTSEEKHEEIDKRGYPRLIYQKIGQSRTSNEPLDCRVYARAALEIVERGGRLETWQEPDYAHELTAEEKKFYDMPFFAPNIIKNTKNSPDLMQFNEETGKIVVKEEGSGVKHPFFDKIGQIGASKRPFDPFSDVDL